MKVAGRIRDLRAKAGLTQAELALALGIDTRRVQQLERGQVPLCGSDFDRYQVHFDCPASYLFGR